MNPTKFSPILPQPSSRRREAPRIFEDGGSWFCFAHASRSLTHRNLVPARPVVVIHRLSPQRDGSWSHGLPVAADCIRGGPHGGQIADNQATASSPAVAAGASSRSKWPLETLPRLGQEHWLLRRQTVRRRTNEADRGPSKSTTKAPPIHLLVAHYNYIDATVSLLAASQDVRAWRSWRPLARQRRSQACAALG